MKTDKTDGLDRLFKAARALEPDISRMEIGFEARTLARIRAERERRVPIFYWAWRLVPVFSALVIALGVWHYASVPQYSIDMHTAFTVEYEGTLALNFPSGD